MPGFRRYFIGSTISVPGNWMQMTAQAWLVLDLTGSPIALAWVTTLQFMPIMLFSLLGGALADRFQRRKLLIGTQIVGAFQAMAFALILISGSMELWHIFALATLLGLVNAMDQPLRQAFITDLVPASALPNGIALNALSMNIGRVVGPALGGVVLAFFGPASAFFLNAVTFVIFAFSLSRIRPQHLSSSARSIRTTLIADVREGLGFAMKTPAVRVLLVATGFIGLFGQNFSTMVPLVAELLLHVTKAQFGLLNSCLGLGSIAAALSLAGAGVPTVRRILLAGLSFGLLLISIALTDALWLSCVLFFGAGAAAVTFSTSVQTSFQLLTPAHMRGRLASMVTLLIVGSSPIGAMLTGVVAEQGAVWLAVALNGAMCILGIALSARQALALTRKGRSPRIWLGGGEKTAPKV
ncbi:MFS transporter [Pseudooceanicola sp.]|uniref:MFS transporter n=1 Tax=Pseudooceanicola sp. TaxID=1914328 RepID=UPI00262424E8|nr:MFS transporter [Pseudooceanicola sp.]MDF1857031.1 MFS transporter [Pseudooceanicola sp.]